MPDNASVALPQSGTTNRVDGIGDRLMFRLAYRNFGDHEAMLSATTASAPGCGPAFAGLSCAM